MSAPSASETAVPGSLPPYELIRSDRKTLSLQVTREGQVVVRAPRFLAESAIRRFVREKSGWIARQLERQQQRPPCPEPTTAELAALKARAKEQIVPLVEQWSRRTGLVPTGVKITSARTRYGSCSGKNSLCFSCFLADFPPQAVEAVVVHELCHIKEKNHGPRFYALLEGFLPDYRARRALLP